MGEELAYPIDVDYRLNVGVVDRSLYLRVLDLLTEHAGKLVVDGVSWAYRDYAAFKRTADKSEVANHVDQLVASRLVVPFQRLGVDVTQLVECHARHIDHVADAVDGFLLRLLVIYHDCIVEVAALDEAMAHESFDFLDKHECARACNLLLEVCQVIEYSELVGQHCRVVFHHHFHAEIVVRVHGKHRTGFLVAHARFLLYNVVVLFDIQLFSADSLDVVYVLYCAAVEYRKFRTVNVNKAVVDARSVQRGESVFHRAYNHIFFAQNSAASGFHHILCNSVNYRGVLEVDAAELIAMIGRCGLENSCDFKSRMKSFALYGERCFESQLVHVCISVCLVLVIWFYC